MSDFLERHGTVLLLYTLLVAMLGMTMYLGIRAHVDGEKLFIWSSGFAGGVWSGLTLAMRVSTGPAPTPPPPVQAPRVEPPTGTGYHTGD